MLHRCPDFLNKKLQERFLIVKSNHMCLICFETGHSVDKCSLKLGCKCGSKHNSLLNFEFKNAKGTEVLKKVQSSPTGPDTAPTSSSQTKSSSVSMSCVNDLENFVILPTALMRFICGNIQGTCRVFLDSCSKPNLISDAFVNKQKLEVSPIAYPNLVKGIPTSPFSVSQSVTLLVLSRSNSFKLEIEADIVPAASQCPMQPPSKTAIVP